MRTELIREENFIRTMREEVEPWLAERRTVFWVRRSTGQSLYCERYLARQPRGVVFISHGFKESTPKYNEPLWYFLHEGYHVYLFEHCGHGRSYRLVDDLSLVHVDRYTRYIEDLLAVARTARRDVDRLEGGRRLPMYLFAHSMGGGIGIAADARAPELFDRLVLSAPMIRPNTAPFSHAVTVAGSAALCAAGFGKRYCPGHHPYDGPGTIDESPYLSLPRFEYFQAIREANPLFQTSAASIGWLHAAMQMETELMHHSAQSADTPILLFEAERDSSVSPEMEEEFVRSRNAAHPGSAVLRKLPGTKHETFDSPNPAIAPLWEELFDFLS